MAAFGDGGGGRHGWWWSPAEAPATTTPIGAGRAYLEVIGLWSVFFAGGVVAAGFSLAGGNPSGSVTSWAEAVPATVDQLATLVICVVLAVVLTARRGPAPPRLGLAPHEVGPARWVRMTAWGLVALVVGGAVTSALATGQYSSGPFSYPNLTVNVAHAVQAGPLEEIVVLAFLVTTLEQARRPRGEIIIVALVLRCSYHLYYGPGVAGIVVWAAVFCWLYLRFRTILPLLVLHSVWDTSIFLGDRWSAVFGVVGLLYVSVLVAAPITWLVARSQRPPPMSGGGARPVPGAGDGPSAWGAPAPPPPG